jgi:hypothetical protein
MIIMKQYFIRRARTFIAVIRRSACHFSSNNMCTMAYTQDDVPDDANVVSFGFVHKIWWGRKLTMMTNKGTVRKTTNAIHLRIRSSCGAISIFVAYWTEMLTYPLFFVGYFSWLVVRIRFSKIVPTLVLAF